MLEVDKKTFEPEVLQAEGYVSRRLFWRWMCAMSGFNATHSLLCREIW